MIVDEPCSGLNRELYLIANVLDLVDWIGEREIARRDTVSDLKANCWLNGDEIHAVALYPTPNRQAAAGQVQPTCQLWRLQLSEHDKARNAK